MRPVPTCWESKPLTALGAAVDMMTAFACSADHFGWACRTRAAEPEVSGAAIDVPDIRVLPVPVPTSTEGTETPGAATSGFGALSRRRGPLELSSYTRA